jgi:hypothetical protein
MRRRISHLPHGVACACHPNEGLFSVSSNYRLENMASSLEDREFTIRTPAKVYHFDSPDAFISLQRGLGLPGTHLVTADVAFRPQGTCLETHDRRTLRVRKY